MLGLQQLRWIASLTSEQDPSSHLSRCHICGLYSYWCLQDMFREVVRKFLREQVAPQQPAFEEAGQPNREVWKALGAMLGER